MIRAYAMLATVSVGCSSPSVAAMTPPPCAVLAPVELGLGRADWVGDCSGGRATGVGVVRIRTGGGVAFFFGRVAGGKPSTGLAVKASGDYMQMRGVDRRGHALLADGEHIPEQDQAWTDAAAGARSAAGRFAASGNKASSNFYRDWARRIATQRPE